MDNTVHVLEMIEVATKQLEADGLPRLQALKARHGYMTILQLIKSAIDISLKLGHNIFEAVNAAYQNALETDINAGTDNAPVVKAMLEVLHPDVQIR